MPEREHERERDTCRGHDSPRGLTNSRRICQQASARISSRLLRGAVITLASMLGACATQPFQQNNIDLVDPHFPPPGEIDDAFAVTAWLRAPEKETANPDLKIVTKPLDCQISDLVPDPSPKSAVIYHRVLRAVFDPARLKRSDRACKIGSTGLDSRKLSPCLISDEGEDVILSAPFSDHCGHHYRAFWQATTLLKDITEEIASHPEEWPSPLKPRSPSRPDAFSLLAEPF